MMVSACASAALIQNGNFENGINPNTLKPAGSTDITGWVVLPANVDWVAGVGTAIPITGTNGSLFIDLNGSDAGGIQQAFATTPGQLYTVTFDMNANTNTGSSKSLQVGAGGTSAAYTFVPQGATDPNWKQQLFQFGASSSTTTLAFVSLTTGTNAGPLIDNVIVTAATPEPTTSWPLLSFSVLAGYTIRRRPKGNKP